MRLLNMKKKFWLFIECMLNILSVFGLIALLVHFTGITKCPLFESSESSDETYYRETREISAKQIDPLYENLVTEPSMAERTVSKHLGEIQGMLTVGVWNHVCGNSMQHLFNSPFFPVNPDEEGFASRTYSKLNKDNYGQRLYGYLSPRITGFYKFIIYSDDNSEFWLGDTDSVDGLRLLAYVSSRDQIGSAPSGEIRSQSQISEDVFLTGGVKYPIEILHYQGKELDFVELQWITPGEHNLKIIEQEFLSSTRQPREIPKQMFGKGAQRNSTGSNLAKPGHEFFHVALLTDWIRKKAVPVCRHTTQSYVKSHVYRYHGHTVIRPSVSLHRGAWILQGNVQVGGRVSSVVNLYMKALEKTYPSRYTLRKIHNLESLPTSSTNGTVYLMELEFDTDGLEYPERVVEYVHFSSTGHNTTRLCFPKGLVWKSDATLHVILSVNSELSWLRVFMRRIEEVVESSLEVYTNVIIIHSDLIRVNLTADLEGSLVKYRMVQLNGTFSRSRAVNAGLRLVDQSNSIVLLTDVHVYFPGGIFEETRKRCIENRLAFIPVAYNLECGFYPNMGSVQGKWCNNVYDVIGLYKSDWDRIGEMDESLTSQGGDWDLVDRILNAGFLTSRVRVPGLYRYYHPESYQDTQSQSLDNSTGVFLS